MRIVSKLIIMALW